MPCITDRRTALIDKLEAAAAWYDASRHWAEKPTPSQFTKRFSAIESAASRLLNSLMLPASGHPNEIPPAILAPLRRRAEAMGKSTPSGWANGDDAVLIHQDDQAPAELDQ